MEEFTMWGGPPGPRADALVGRCFSCDGKAGPGVRRGRGLPTVSQANFYRKNVIFHLGTLSPNPWDLPLFSADMLDLGLDTGRLLGHPACPRLSQSLGSHPCVALSCLPKHFQFIAEAHLARLSQDGNASGRIV